MIHNRVGTPAAGSKIFISHSSSNNPQALALARWLEDQGWDDYFLDLSPTRGLAPGERWQEALKTAADRCEVVVFVISPAWRDSRWCLAEFLLSKQLGKTIFGVLVEATPLDTLPPEMTVEWQLCDLVSGSARRTFRVTEEPVVPEIEVSFSEAGLARLKTGLERAGLDAITFAWPPLGDPTRVPYRGLRALEAEDAAVFFGRDTAIVRGLDALRAMREVGVERILAILGASGSGKSSFLRAGLLPRLARDDRHFLPLPVIRPERAVINGGVGLAASLQEAFGKAGAPKNLADVRRTVEDPAGLVGLLAELQEIARARTGDDTPPTIVISIDQGEELFGAEGRTESERMLSLLATVLSARDDGAPEAIAARRRALAVVAIRSDSCERLQTEPRLQGIKPNLFSLPPIARTEYREVIEGPADRQTRAGHRLVIEPVLSDRLLQDAEGVDALPLLAFTLERLLVEYGTDGELSLRDYEALGGVSGSIGAAVETAFDQPDRPPKVPGDRAERERLLRRGFVPWLARVDPDTEERKRRVARWDEIPAEAGPVLERLVAQRLLLRDRRRLDGGTEETDVIEVAHEALLRQWHTLTTWLDEDADALKAVEAVRRAAAEWAKNRRGDAWLVHAGERLRLAQTLRDRADLEKLLGADGRTYLDACIDREAAARAERDVARFEHEAQLKRIEAEQSRVAQEQALTARAQRLSKRVMAVAAVVVVAIGIGLAGQQRRVAREASLVLASEATRASDAGYYDKALLYASLALRRGWLSPAVPEAEAQLARAAHASRVVATLRGHGAPVLSAAFGPDGRRVVTASWDHTVRVWDVATGQQAALLTGHDDIVASAEFSPDGLRVVTASYDKTARVWDATSGQQVALLQGHHDQVWSAAFSPDGQRVVTASRDKTVRVWDAGTGQQLALLQGHDDAVWSAAFSPDGRGVLTASEDRTARVWEPTSGKQVALLQGHDGPIRSAAFSQNGRLVLTASLDKTARIWDAGTGKQVALLKGHDDAVWSAAFSPDARRVLTASDDRTARVWDPASGQEVARLQGHDERVRSGAFSPDGRRVVTGSLDNTARVWDAATGQQEALLFGHDGTVASAVFSSDGRRVVTGSWDGTARVWDAVTRRPMVLPQGHGHDDITDSAAFSPDGQRVLTACGDTAARVWDARTGQQVALLQGHGGTIMSAAFSPDGRRVVTASEDKTARVWDAATGGQVALLHGHDDRVWSAAFSPDGRHVVTASEDTTARVWDAATGKQVAFLQGHDGTVISAAFSPDGRHVVTASADATARVWDAVTGREVALLQGHSGDVWSAAFSPDGRHVVTASADATARIWDTATGQQVALLRGHDDAVLSAVYDPDGQHVVTVSLDKKGRVWNATSGKQVALLQGHDGPVRSAAFSPDGRRVVTGSFDRTARLWDVATGQQVALLQGHGDTVWSATFSPDGRRIVTASDDGTARVWDVEWLTKSTEQLIEGVCGTRLQGARILGDRDVQAAPILAGRSGEDVCAPSTFARMWATARSW